MKRLAWAAIIAITAAAALSVFWESEPYDETLVRVQAARTLGPVAAEVRHQPVEVQALMLDYSADPVLLLSARLALLHYPAPAAEVLAAFGMEPEFQTVLRRHGAAVIPPITYFQNNEIRSLQLRRAAERGAQALGEMTGHLRGSAAESGPDAGALHRDQPLSARERGWYAIEFIDADGYNFLGQFVVDGEGHVRWIQTERLLENVNWLFAGGVRTLERKYRMADETVTTTDALWAGADVMVIGGTLKLLRLSRTASQSGRPLGVVDRTRLYRAGVWSGAKSSGRLAGYAAIPAFGYLLVKHPALLHGFLGEVGQALGIRPEAARFWGWALILFGTLYLLSWIGRVAIRPAMRLFAAGLALFVWLEQRRPPEPPTVASGS